jgi:hypothetical protein
VGSGESVEDTVASGSRKSQVFNVRCPRCQKEKPYRTREIVDFEGTPETPEFPERPAPMRWYASGGFAKAAKA